MIIRVVSIILVLVGLARLLFPEIIKMPDIQIDGYVICFVLAGIFLWNNKNLKKIFIMLKKHKNNILKVSITFLCIAVIILRMFVENIRFDNTSLYILVLLIVTMLVPDLQELLLRIKRVKKGDFELEWSEIVKDLKDKVEEVEEKQTKENNEESGEVKESPLKEGHSSKEHMVKDIPGTYKAEKVKKEADPFEEEMKKLVDHPRPLLILIAAQIENRVRSLVFSENEKMMLTHKAALKEAIDRKIISKDIWILNEKFMKVRNYAVHGLDSQINESELYEAIELGLRILKLLPTVSENK